MQVPTIPLMAKEFTELPLFSLFYVLVVLLNMFFPPQIARWVCITVLEDNGAFWFSHPFKSTRGPCDGQLDRWRFCAFQRQHSLCSFLFIIPFCNSNVVCDKLVFCISFLSFLQIKLTLNSKWIPSHWFVESWSSLWNPHNKTTTNVMALLWTLAQYHSLGRKLSGHWRTCQGLWCISSLLGCSIARIIPASWLFISGDSSEQPVFCPVLTPNVSSVIRSRNRESILTFICKKPAVQCDTYWQFGQIFTSHCASRGGLLLL